MNAMAVAELATNGSNGAKGVAEDLTPAELRHLGSLERKIERGLATFREVGDALLEIRDNRLFRMTHATFESYCNERWQLARQRAYQIMGAAEVVQALGPAGDRVANEFQARELVPLLHTDPKLLPKVVIALDEAGDDFSAASLRKAVHTVAGTPDPTPPTATEKLVNRLNGIATEYAEWQKTRPSRG